jgi:hypothetical protein
MNNPAFYQAVTTSLNIDQQTHMMTVMARAEELEKQTAEATEGNA